MTEPTPRKSPLSQVAESLASLGMDNLARYCKDNPPSTGKCRTCDTSVVSTPCMIGGTFLLASTGWVHEATGSSSCGRDYPYKFAEPQGQP